ncbi:MAG TPA: F0F1 ATP synthase subunit B [Candidatus Saccharimonadales bacterium]|nr:F0F1 ATP synthase subunit B [Candidatus Saccharimonadales bacterium]
MQSFVFQLITFILVLVLLRMFVYKKLVATLESRRAAVEQSLDQAKESAAELEQSREKVAGLIKQARAEADDIVATGQKESAAILDAAREKAVTQAEHIVTEAQARIEAEVRKARTELKKETIQLVAMATEKIIGEKLDPKKDEQLITRALETAKK